MNADTGQMRSLAELDEKELASGAWSPMAQREADELAPLGRTQRLHLWRNRIGTGHPGSKKRATRAQIKARRKKGRR